MENNTNNPGRPTEYSEALVSQLEECLKNGFTVSAACRLVGIHRDTYYDWHTRFEGFSDRMQYAKDFALEAARQVVVKSIIEGDVQTSKWYLERKAKDEFSTRSEQTGKDGEALYTGGKEELQDLVAEIKELLTDGKQTATESTADSENDN